MVTQSSRGIGTGWILRSLPTFEMPAQDAMCKECTGCGSSDMFGWVLRIQASPLTTRITISIPQWDLMPPGTCHSCRYEPPCAATMTSQHPRGETSHKQGWGEIQELSAVSLVHGRCCVGAARHSTSAGSKLSLCECLCISEDGKEETSS